MARTFIQLPADSTGKAVLSFDFTEAGSPAPNAGVRHAQGMVLCDSSGAVIGVLGSSLSVRRPAASAAAVTNVAASAASVTLVASNANRRGLLVFNDSTANLYLKYGATASATSFTVPLGPGGLFEMPEPIYSGIVDGIWSAANGAARITELT